MGSPILALEPTAEGVGVQHHRKDGQSIASKAAPRGAAHYSGLFHESHIGSIYMVGGGNKADESLLRERLARRRPCALVPARRGLQHRLTGGRARLKMRMCLMAKCPRLRMRPRKAWGRKPSVCIRAALVHPNGCDGLHTVSLSFVRGPVTRLYVT